MPKQPVTDNPPPPPSRLRRTLAMLSLVLAGEAIFVPLYHLNRYFKSSFESVFAIDAMQIGDLFVWLGSVATACYLLGGPLADRVSPRKMLVGSLLATAAGAVYMATLPSFAALKWLFAFWGASSILAFWAPLLRATREWGGALAQGRAFGLLDGGRGLASAVIASAAALLFSSIVGAEATPQREALAVRWLMGFYAACCVASAACVWFFLPSAKPSATENEPNAVESKGRVAALATVTREVFGVLRLPAVWLQALVILTAYTAFRGFDNYGKYAEVAFGLDPAGSALLTSTLSYLRAGAALAAGAIADRWLGVSTTLCAAFALLVACFGLLLATPAESSFYALAVANMAVSAAAFFGLRGVYFALLEESSVPAAQTGMAIGVVSFFGFTPDIFFPKLYGWLVTSAIEAGDEMLGYQRLFAILAGFAAVGLLAALALRVINRRAEQPA